MPRTSKGLPSSTAGASASPTTITSGIPASSWMGTRPDPGNTPAAPSARLQGVAQGSIPHSNMTAHMYHASTQRWTPRPSPSSKWVNGGFCYSVQSMSTPYFCHCILTYEPTFVSFSTATPTRSSLSPTATPKPATGFKIRIPRDLPNIPEAFRKQGTLRAEFSLPAAQSPPTRSTAGDDHTFTAGSPIEHSPSMQPSDPYRKGLEKGKRSHSEMLLEESPSPSVKYYPIFGNYILHYAVCEKRKFFVEN